MFDAVIFDMDGLMIDTEKVWERSKRTACRRLNIPFSAEFDNLTRATSGTTFARLVEEHFSSIGYPGIDGQAFLNEVWSLSDEAFEQRVDKKPSLDELIVWLNEKGIARAIASASTIAQIKHHLSMIGWSDAFTMIISGFDLERAKPAPDIFLKAADRLGADPARTVVLEDSPNGIRAAAAGGFIPIMVPDRESPEQVNGLYRHVCANLLEVRDLLASGNV